MDLVLHYTVHSAVVETAPLKATLNGVEVNALVPRMVVELTADDGDHGHTFRLAPCAQSEQDARLAAFPVGAKVKLTLTAGE
ncbi:MAG TPA: hypothetical protein VIO57_10225 [Chloroflexota bacterium]|jgi:hypothetical protein